MKKIFMRLFVILFIPVIIWFGTVLRNNYLTEKYSSEFLDHQKIGYDFLHPWNNEFDLRVLRYSPKKATVYFYGNDGGEKVVFIKDDEQWKYQKTIAIWSSQGSADNYFIWPYYKNCVP